MVTLDRLINVLSGYGVRPLASVPSREAALHSVVVHDPAAPESATGDAVLAVGERDLVRAVELAVAAQAVAVLVHEPDGRSTAEGEPGRAAELAARHRVAVLVVEAAVSWSQVCGVVYGLVLEGGETESGRGPSDLFALADAIAATVGGQVTVEDRLSRVVAYSSWQQDADPARLDTILGRRVSAAVRELFERRGVFRHLAVSAEPLFVAPSPEHGLRGRMVAGVRAGRELLGSVWVTCDEPLTGRALRQLRDGAEAVALHLLRSRVSADLERQVESELVLQLLEGTPDAASVCGKLGLPPGPCRVVAVQAHADDERHAAVLLAYDRATTGFGWSRPGRSTLFGNTVYTLLPGGDDPEAARAWVAELVRDLPDQVTVAAGIGGLCELSEIPAGRHEADECLALHVTRPGGEPVDHDESWHEILLQRLRTAAEAGRYPTRGPVVELARHDAARHTRYVPTLRAWLEAQGDLGAAAAALDVHPNTVRYRLRKMGDVVRLNLGDPATRLALVIALAVSA
ncbi:PucR family transcriptional regulator [Saccharomonospora piscinae]|uniref:PucR family transcriptional regulator n=1 Tax=Saccharomonospora piscinae TaxID=687388 RepID=A0A1V9AA41_SACPI|nr:PucR family transcriptional regulator [Saccharomonospora piscinae]OQO93928.1 PucR family transcriptional regulator [Saccharomonospora piscinae]TLW95099.1 PucR family transcriptional regulator [Saccharomonospora piscinae]